MFPKTRLSKKALVQGGNKKTCTVCEKQKKTNSRLESTTVMMMIVTVEVKMK